MLLKINMEINEIMQHMDNVIQGVVSFMEELKWETKKFSTPTIIAHF
jgi:hypothetical protein